MITLQINENYLFIDENVDWKRNKRMIILKIMYIRFENWNCMHTMLCENSNEHDAGIWMKIFANNSSHIYNIRGMKMCTKEKKCLFAWLRNFI